MGIMLLLFVLLIITLNNLEIKRNNFADYQHQSGNNYVKTLLDQELYDEYRTFAALRKLPGHKALLTNLYIPRNNGSTTEIDLVLINEKGLYVFESRNFEGDIYGDETKKNWIQSYNNKGKVKFLNPIWQNEVHIKALKELLNLHTTDFFKSYIVFNKQCTLKKLYIESPHVSVLKRNTLLLNIKKDMLSSKNVFTIDEVNQLETILQLQAHAKSETNKICNSSMKQLKETQNNVIELVSRKPSKK